MLVSVRPIALAVAIIATAASPSAGATDLGIVAQRPVVIPQLVTIPQALDAFRAHGFDALLADAAAMHAEGDVDAAAHVANPGLTLSGGRTFNVLPTQPAYAFSIGVSDNGAIFDVLTGKRTLRARAARAALEAARDHRASVELGLELVVKQAYVQVGLGRLVVEFTEQQSQSLDKTLGIAKLRFPAVIDESDLARVELQKLAADQATTRARQMLRGAQTSMAMLLGHRGVPPDFDIDRGVLGYRKLPSLATATESSLLAVAFQHRPEIIEMRASVAHFDEALSYERRRVFPDIAIGGFIAGEQTSSSNVISPDVVGGSLSANLPIFYQQQGEVRRAEGDLSGAAITSRRVVAQISLDVSMAFAQLDTARRQVDRMLGGELDAAVRQRDVLQKQFDAGKADLNDYLDAQRTYLMVHLEYLQFVAAYWNAVFALERATGVELR